MPLDGTVQQIEDAFNVRMNVYQHPTENRTFYSADREPSLALSVPVAHITGLDDFNLPHPALKRVSTNDGSPVPAAGSGPGGQYLASDMRAAYYGGTALTGSGQVVALVEFDGYNISDVNMSFSSVGQSYSVPVQNVLLDGATGAPCQLIPNNCDDAEQVLDIVQAIGMAPGLSQVRVYIGSSDVDILNAILNENTAKQVSISWVWGPNYNGDHNIFVGMQATGQSVFAASGDWGSYPAIHPAYPAEDPNVTAVGGTHLNTTGAGGPWQYPETAWADAGGGPSPDGISIPSYQSGLNGVNGASVTLRNVPDVAAEADFDNYYCDLGSCGGGLGGTSFATPRWAGFMALINQQAVAAGSAPLGGMGFINPALYSIGEGSNYTSDFHDVTSGCNGGYCAGPGFDLVTGWGSPNGQNLIDALAGPQGTPGTTTVTITGSERSIYFRVCPYGSNAQLPQNIKVSPLAAGGCWVWDNGYVTLTVNGRNYTAWFDYGSTTTSVASDIKTAISNDSGAQVSATLSGSSITLTAKTTGTSTDYPFSFSAGTSDWQDFTGSSFNGSPASGNLTGGS